jgi:hypothetical protein
MRKDTTMTDEKILHLQKKAITISIWALAISIIALTLSSMYTFWDKISPPNVKVYPPPGYTIIRELADDPSDHLVIPFEFENKGGTTAIIRNPSLVLHDVNSDAIIVYKHAGIFNEISFKEFSEIYGYVFRRSILVEPHSVTSVYLVFHILKWWKKDSDYYIYRFPANHCFKVWIRYDVNQKPINKDFLFDLTIFGSADRLDRESNYWWDYWSLGGTSCKDNK